MSALIDGPLAKSLERGRERYNARFAQARRLNGRLDPEVFALCLAIYLKPVVEVVHKVDAERVEIVTETLYDIALDLLSRDLIGESSRYPLINETWQKLFPAVAHKLAEKPETVAAALLNATYNISSQTGARPRKWIEIMLKLASCHISVAEFLTAGRVAAWRSGMAHYRAGAIEALVALSDKTANIALGIFDEEKNAPKERLIDELQHTWRKPGSVDKEKGHALAIVAKVGGFSGFGGSFVTPPEVIAVDGALYGFDEKEGWLICADRFGATFHRIGDNTPAGGDEPKTDITIDKRGIVTKGGITATFPELAGAKSFAVTGDTLAVTIPTSHKVYMVAQV